jgi:CRISPR/Cas system CMR-associated protein Cmr5 small subunit
MISAEKKYVGIEYLDMQYNKNIVEDFSEKHNAYLVKIEGMVFHNLVNESEIEFFLSKQERIFEAKSKSEQTERAEKEQKEKAEYEYNNVNGFCDTMPVMQKGKVLKVLNVTCVHKGKIVTRKEFILDLINEGYNLKVIDKVMTSSKKIRGERIEKFKCNVPAIEKDGTWYEITKTEYEYGLFLQNKTK